MLIIHFQERIDWMNIIYADYNIYHNSIDICTYVGYILRIDCAKAEEGLITTPNSECALNALAIDNPLEYARLYLDGTMHVNTDELVHAARSSSACFPVFQCTLSAA